MNKNTLSPKQIAKYIDHTNVKIDATQKSIKDVCDEAIKYGFHSVCVTPTRVAITKKYLGKNWGKIAVIAVIGFPFGFTTTKAKAIEAREAVSNGATEIDMVINLNAIKDGDWDYVKQDIFEVVKSSNPVSVKVIMETGFLTENELFKACQIAEDAGAKFVKTATGYGVRGAELHDIVVMKRAIGNRLKIKASGGIHDYETAITMLQAGADRIGTSSGLDIIGVEDKTYKKDKKIAYNY